MKLASEAVAVNYLQGVSVVSDVLRDALAAADEWTSQRVQLNGSIPLYVSEAASLLAAVIACDPRVPADEAAIPNAVRLMILPAAR